MILTLLNLINYYFNNKVPFYLICGVIIILYIYIIIYYNEYLLNNNIPLITLIILLIIDLSCIIAIYTNYFNDDITINSNIINDKIEDKKSNKKEDKKSNNKKNKKENLKLIKKVNKKNVSIDDIITFKTNMDEEIYTYNSIKS